MRSNFLISMTSLLALALAGGCSKDDSPAPLPDMSEATYTGTGLELYYQGEAMPGKRAVVKVDKDGGKLDMTFNSILDLSEIAGAGLTGQLQGPGITPGDAVLTLSAPYTAGDGVYVVSGDGSTDYLTFKYAGEVGKDKMTFSLTDCKLKNTMLAGNVFAPAPLKREGLMDITSMPFHLVWELDPAAGIEIPLSEVLKGIVVAPVIPVYEGTAYTSLAQAFCSLVKTMALTESGNVPVMYVSTLGGAAHVATTCGNMIQYVPAENGVKLYLNPLSVFSEFLLATSNNKNDEKFDFAEMFKAASETGSDATSVMMDPAVTKALLMVMIESLAPQIAGGVPMALEPTAVGADLYFDTATSVTFLATVLQNVLKNPELSALLQQELGKLDLPGVKPEQVGALLQALPGYLTKTTRLEIGLSLVKAS